MAFTTLEDEEILLASWVATGRAAVDIIGSSVQGRTLRAVRFGNPPQPPATRAVLLLVGDQHGWEKSTREGILQFGDRLATTATAAELAWLETHQIVLMPTCNPDGFEIDQRNNANNVDINRDHITLSQPETRAIATVLRDARPGFVLDVHAANIDHDAEFQLPINVQTDPLIAARSAHAVTAMKAHLQDAGHTSGDWPGVGPGEHILHNNAGLRNRAGAIVETLSTVSEADRIALALAACEAGFAYAQAFAAELFADSDAAQVARAAAGVLGETFELRTTVLDPAPIAYQLTNQLVEATALHRDVYGIATTPAGGFSTVSMGQAAQPVIPFLFDTEAEFSVAAGARVQVAVSATPPVVARATVNSRITWLACDVVTGRKIAELPDITGEVSRVLSSYTSAGLALPAPTGGPGHLPYDLLEQATRPIRNMIVLVVNDVPSWAGWIKDRQRGTDAMWSLPCVTLEAYLRARRIGDHLFAGQDLAAIAAGLLADAADLPDIGTGIGLVIDAVPTGIVRSRTYLASDRATVYDGLRELAGVGIDWTVDLDWEDERHQVVTRIARVRSRIGRVAAQPKARFATLSSSEARYMLAEDHTEGRYANYVVAYAPGEGLDQLASAPAIDKGALDGGAPIVEVHWQPSSSIIEAATLDEHAAARLARNRNGSLTWQLTARWDQPPRLNVDWALGDDIGWDLVGHGHPGGVSGVGRAIGWSFDPATGLASPILLDPASDSEAAG